MNPPTTWIAGILLILAAAGCRVSQAGSDASPERGDAVQADPAGPAPEQDQWPPVQLSNTAQFELVSHIVPQTFRIKVSFPRGYHQGRALYPVLYVTDAETNFGGVTYIVQRLIKDRLIPPLLVVGIAYGTDYETFYELRSRDLTPTEIPGFRAGGKVMPTGGAEAFFRFLQQELVPEIERRYQADPNDRAFYGHSYGGLFGSYVLLNQPGLFQRYLMLSPSLWFDDARMLQESQSPSLDLGPAVVYMAAGALENRIDDELLVFSDALRKHASKKLRLLATVLDNETHRTVFGRGFTDGLRFIYADR